ncbi:MAG: cupredoxin domain-containing protein, partial [Nitrososphaeraceae archaeon]
AGATSNATSSTPGNASSAAGGGGADNATTTSTTTTATTNTSTATTPGAGAGALPATTAAATLKIPQGASVQGNPSYDPDSLTVKVGDTIAVDNEDSTPHTVTNGKDATDPNMGKLFDTSIINAGDSSEIVTTDLKPGEYPFFCSVHPYMTGTMTVQ